MKHHSKPSCFLLDIHRLIYDHVKKRRKIVAALKQSKSNQLTTSSSTPSVSAPSELQPKTMMTKEKPSKKTKNDREPTDSAKSTRTVTTFNPTGKFWSLSLQGGQEVKHRLPKGVRLTLTHILLLEGQSDKRHRVYCRVTRRQQVGEDRFLLATLKKGLCHQFQLKIVFSGSSQSSVFFEAKGQCSVHLSGTTEDESVVHPLDKEPLQLQIEPKSQTLQQPQQETEITTQQNSHSPELQIVEAPLQSETTLQNSQSPVKREKKKTEKKETEKKSKRNSQEKVEEPQQQQQSPQIQKEKKKTEKKSKLTSQEKVQRPEQQIPEIIDLENGYSQEQQNGELELTPHVNEEDQQQQHQKKLKEEKKVHKKQQTDEEEELRHQKKVKEEKKVQQRDKEELQHQQKVEEEKKVPKKRHRDDEEEEDIEKSPSFKRIKRFKKATDNHSPGYNEYLDQLIEDAEDLQQNGHEEESAGNHKEDQDDEDNNQEGEEEEDAEEDLETKGLNGHLDDADDNPDASEEEGGDDEDGEDSEGESEVDDGGCIFIDDEAEEVPESEIEREEAEADEEGTDEEGIDLDSADEEELLDAPYDNPADSDYRADYSSESA